MWVEEQGRPTCFQHFASALWLQSLACRNGQRLWKDFSSFMNELLKQMRLQTALQLNQIIQSLNLNAAAVSLEISIHTDRASAESCWFSWTLQVSCELFNGKCAEQRIALFLRSVQSSPWKFCLSHALPMCKPYHQSHCTSLRQIVPPENGGSSFRLLRWPKTWINRFSILNVLFRWKSQQSYLVGVVFMGFTIT